MVVCFCSRGDELVALLTGCGSVSLWPSFLVIGTEAQKHPAHRAAVRMQERGPCCSHSWGLAHSECLPDASSPAEAWPHAWPPLLAAGRQAPSSGSYHSGYFLASAQRRPWWELGSRKRRRELSACCPLWAGTECTGSTGVADSEDRRSVVVGDFSLSRGRKLLLHWDKGPVG